MVFFEDNKAVEIVKIVTQIRNLWPKNECYKDKKDKNESQYLIFKLKKEKYVLVRAQEREKYKEISSKMRPVFEFDEIFAMEKRVDAFNIDSL